MKKIVLLLVILISNACSLLGPKNIPPGVTVTPVAKTAIYGRQFIAAGNGVLRGLDIAMGNQLLPTQYGVPVLRVMKLVGEEAVRLADVLDAIDTASDPATRNNAVGRAKAIIAGMQALVDNATIPIPDPKVRAFVQSLLATFSSIIAQFGDSLLTLVNLAREADTLRSVPEAWQGELQWALLQYSPSY